MGGGTQSPQSWQKATGFGSAPSKPGGVDMSYGKATDYAPVQGGGSNAGGFNNPSAGGFGASPGGGATDYAPIQQGRSAPVTEGTYPGGFGAAGGRDFDGFSNPDAGWSGGNWNPNWGNGPPFDWSQFQSWFTNMMGDRGGRGF